MKRSGNTVMITGGSSGIGLEMAKRFLAAGNKVIVVSRNEKKLQAVKDAYPEIIIHPCDVTKEEERVALFNWVVSEYPEINIYFNDAGMMRQINLLKAAERADWSDYEYEIKLNLCAPIHMETLFAPYFAGKKDTAIINISSRLGIMTAAWVPIYTATKAGLHLFTRALRMQLQYKSVKVIEILPAIVSTQISGYTGTPVEEFADAVFEKLWSGADEIGYGVSEIALTDAYTQSVMQEEAQQRWLRVAGASPDLQDLLTEE